MPPPFTFASRRFIVWLLACLVPLQAMAAGAIAAAGPAHNHLPAAAARLVLDDFRRAPIRPAAVQAHGAKGFGHFHAGEGAERHPHASGDATVVVDAADRLQAGDADDLGISPSLGLFVGLISAPPRRLDATPTVAPAAPPRWTLQTHHPAFPERPPRAG